MKIQSHLVLVIVVLLAIVLSSNLPRQDYDNSMARVQRSQGKYVFVMCEPINEYEVVDNVGTIAGVFGETMKLDDAISEMLGKSINRERKGKIGKFDGMITQYGNIGTLIKFKE